MKNLIVLAGLGLAGASLLPAQEPAASNQAASQQMSEKAILRMASDIQKRIVTLPEFGVFDSLSFSFKGDNVILKGYASRPILKSSAEKVTKGVEGVASVTNNIEVLPLSPADDDIRARVYVAIYGHPTLSRYNPNRGAPLFPSLTRRTSGITNDPPIGFHPVHIIVRNGNVTLEGVMDTAGDRTIAEIQANSVPGVFSVTNNILTTDGKSMSKSSNRK